MELRKKIAFSLAEMMVVMAIMSVVAAITVPLITKKMKSNPVAPASASSVPAGTIVAYAGPNLPADGWLWCDGASLQRSSYPALFTAIGTSYGSANGSSFNIPNLKGNVPVGKDSSLAYAAALNQTGGEPTHTITPAQLPTNGYAVADAGAHDHGGTTTGAGGAHTHPSISGAASSSMGVQAGPGSGHVISWSGNTGSGGGSHNHTIPSVVAHTHSLTAPAGVTGDTPFTNMQPYVVVNYIIKY